jgi:hypothetical protein
MLKPCACARYARIPGATEASPFSFRFERNNALYAASVPVSLAFNWRRMMLLAASLTRVLFSMSESEPSGRRTLHIPGHTASGSMLMSGLRDLLPTSVKAPATLFKITIFEHDDAGLPRSTASGNSLGAISPHRCDISESSQCARADPTPSLKELLFAAKRRYGGPSI